MRPFLTASPGRLTTVDYIGENGELMLVNPGKNGGKDSRKSFSFNKCFGPNATQGAIFHFEVVSYFQCYTQLSNIFS